METAPSSARGGACVDRHTHDPNIRTLKRTISARRIDGSVQEDRHEKKLASVVATCAQQQKMESSPCDDLRVWMTTLAPTDDGDVDVDGDWCHCRQGEGCPCQLLVSPNAVNMPPERNMPPPAPAWSLDKEQDYLSPVNLHASVLAYLQEMCATSPCVRTFTMAQVQQLIVSVPMAVQYMEHVVQDRLGISWTLVQHVVHGIVGFVQDEDVKDATVVEFAGFLHSVQHTLYESMPLTNIFANLDEFFGHVLMQFKKYLVQTWIQAKRISAPCEFGKKSDKLFLCMECHREHR